MTRQPSKTASATLAMRGIDRDVADWYKDAVIYQLHIKAFQDSNGDGIGDFAGLMQRLDYVQELGVTAIWLLPFYPSPLRDDGYDIADYRAINPSYGTMKDFKAFVAEAHKRGIRVITELVINHTSDQHPWFQKARQAKPGSAARDWYVWSDTDDKWPETRIIFLDTEKSNWSWDPVAGAYYWHRFYSHQPDLNFDNPRVLQEVLKVMRMWLDMGVDGLRLDAIPYLVERDGTNNENLPETHDVLKAIRADLDAHFPDRMLLAEANQWPEDTRPYFGDGDECHMGFHFPLMPRMYMALAQADRHPITDIIRQTPDIPESCQWAIFLRNHDELTLEMVTSEDRDYLWQTYAADTRARINLGIRRRLAPLMQNDRRKIQLLNSLLMSMPGTPIIYYGDEIGMGDNYYLGDRDGVRTPMQWTGDRNAGFSAAKPQQLYLPTITDAVYGHQVTNVEAQTEDPSSLLNWMRRMINVRKQHPAFGRGTMTLLYPRNRKILAYIREYDNKSYLCVANLSDSAQAVELDLSAHRGLVPVELTGRSAFPPVGDLPYMLTLSAYGFFWFALSDDQTIPSWHEQLPEILPEFMTLTSRDGQVSTALAGREGQQFQNDLMVQWLPLQRWFAAKDVPINAVKLVPLGSLGQGQHVLVRVDVSLGNGEDHRYFLPISAQWGNENLRPGAPKLSWTMARIRHTARMGALVDGAFNDTLPQLLLHAIKQGDRFDGLSFHGTDALRDITDPGPPRQLGVEQSNLSIAFSDRIILKLYRRLRSGDQPDVEVPQFLTQAGFAHTPQYLGHIAYHDAETAAQDTTTLAAAFAFVPNRGDAWAGIIDALALDVNQHETWTPTDDTDQTAFGYPLSIGPLLGQRTAELHRALATDTDDPAFRLERLTQDHLHDWSTDAMAEAETLLSHFDPARLPEDAADLARQVLARRDTLMTRLRDVGQLSPSGHVSRIHGDYHLGQVLLAQNDIAIIDFEGEPARTLAERRAKSSPLRDVAGMLRSIDYAALTVATRQRANLGDNDNQAFARIEDWRRSTASGFLHAYHKHAEGTANLPRDAGVTRQLLYLFLLQKAVYETRYERANRPDWVAIPLRGILDLLDREPS